MTIKNKIATSIVASALIATVSFAAGTISYSSGNATSKVAQELFDLGNQSLDISTTTNRLVYKANFLTLDYGQSISNPKVYLKFDGNVTLPAGDVFAILDDQNVTVAQYSGDIAADGSFVLNGIDNTQITNGKSYTIETVASTSPLDGTTTAVPTNTAKLNGSEADFNNATATLSVWTGSGTQVEVDKTIPTKLFTSVAQYNVYCENKLNNLINVENSSYTFVSTKHGALNDMNGTNGDVMNVLRDVMRFKVVKNTVDFGLDGNGSMLQIHADQNLTTMLDSGSVTSDFANIGTFNSIVAITASDINISDNPAIVSAGFDGNNSSTNTYTVTFDVNGTATILPTNFKADFYVNAADYNTTVTPKGDYTPNADIGSWRQFAYIAQIAGATEDAATKTKLFITNRSCKAVTPQLTLIEGGKKVTVTLPSIGVDAQGKVLLGDIIAANQDAIVAAGLPTTGRYAVELTIPGNAEDFYVYAQAQSKTDIAATKDLPVYSTSTRTN